MTPEELGSPLLYRDGLMLIIDKPAGLSVHKGPKGGPSLEDVIRADRHLDDIGVRRSTGDKALDQAALKILRLAAPFAPLPDSIRANYDVLRFAYEWDFSPQARAAP